jgi:hypothetical protein
MNNRALLKLNQFNQGAFTERAHARARGRGWGEWPGRQALRRGWSELAQGGEPNAEKPEEALAAGREAMRAGA